jgi:protein involved in polysaccharide export with SLBB domain
MNLMRLLLILTGIFALLTASVAQSPEARLKPGDTIGVIVSGFEQYTGEYKVLSDGSVSGHGFGRVLVQGRTLGEAHRMIEERLRQNIRNPQVTVLLKEQREEFVYLAGFGGQAGGSRPYVPGMTLRQLVTTVDLPTEPDQFEVYLFRAGAPERRAVLLDVLAGRDPIAASPLAPNDVLTVLPLDFVRVWVTGLVAQPGEIRVRRGTDLYQAVAQAGGIAKGDVQEEDLQILHRRGMEVQRRHGRQDPGESPIQLETGDTLVVQSNRIRLLVGGEVKTPGELQVRAGTTVAGALVHAGGPTSEGTLQEVVLVRNGMASVLDLSRTDDEPIEAQDGDVLMVRENQRAFLALGHLNQPTRVVMEDGKSYRLADALSAGGGLAQGGVNTRVYLGRPDEAGKYQVREYNLDRFLKGGDMEQNPELRSGDIVMFGQTRGLTMSHLGQGLSSALLIDTLFRRR